jgi:DNA-binding transcriptional ArsR family regulator
MEEGIIKLKAEILKPLSQPTRLKILECLKSGEKCIWEIVPEINGEQSNVSRHISVMQKSRLPKGKGPDPGTNRGVFAKGEPVGTKAFSFL